MTDDPWRDALGPFGENGPDKKPDVTALAALLRSDIEISRGARHALAEIIDPIYRGDLTVGWELRLSFTDKQAKTRYEMRAEKNLDAELKRGEIGGRSLTSMMSEAAEKVGVSTRSAWTLWKRVLLPRRRREEQERQIDDIILQICPSVEAFQENPGYYREEAKRRLLQKPE